MNNVSKSFLDKLYVPTQLIPTVPRKELLMVLPFVGKSYMSMRTRLYKSVSKLLPHSNIKVVCQSKKRLSNLLKFKDSVPYVPTLFINISVVIAILRPIVKLNVILRLELVSV